MPRSIWKGAVSFGMISIPVKLLGATENKDIAFRQLHSECGGRLKQQRWCTTCERTVEFSELVKGFEHAKEQHVILTDEDFSKLPLASKHTIELSAFVKAEEIDPVYYERSYYLEPEETGLKPFALLMDALKKKNLTAVAKVAIRNKEQLCAIRPHNGRLMLETLINASGELVTPKLSDATGYPVNSARRILEELMAIGMVERQLNGSTYAWELSENAKGWHQQIALPKMSVHGREKEK